MDRITAQLKPARIISISPAVADQVRALGLHPKDLVLYVTSHCNLRCRHCYVGNDLLNESRVMKAQSVHALLNGFGALDRVTIIGGEPLLHREFRAIQTALGEAPSKERRIDTNLTSIHTLDIGHVLNKGIRICVSLDGHTEATHAILRGAKMFRKTETNLQKLLARGVDVEVTHTVHARNIGDIDAFIDYCRRSGISRLNLHKISPRGNAIGQHDLLLRPRQWIVLVGELRERAKRPGSPPIHIRFETLYVTEDEARRLRQEGRYHDLARGSFYSGTAGHRIVVFPDGKIYISSESFGSDSYVASIEDGNIVPNPAPRNELELSRKGYVRITELNPRAEVDAEFPVVLSVSYRESHVI
jgi:MoaA/NifB/PqqE/SkfB family radical SAM enzyme